MRNLFIYLLFFSRLFHPKCATYSECVCLFFVFFSLYKFDFFVFAHFFVCLKQTIFFLLLFDSLVYVFRWDAVSQKGRHRENVCRQRCVCVFFLTSSHFSSEALLCVLFFLLVLLAAEIFISNSFSVLVSACTNRSIHVYILCGAV